MEDTHRSQYRLPWALYEALKAAAEKNRRPLNAELVARLETTFPQLNVDASAEARQLYDTVSKMSLVEVMTPAELTMLAERMVQIVSSRETK
ncbi:Arc family DNA-binding protein [Pandoraea sputorum]|uniref:Arc family DNA-binding protein n=1 Tax=Pandoraea sputorum TaxID=93222 RepID=UPI00123FAFE8|nr:Arc family DNA-binding protein [Pandoraea sputorum]VVE59051.1 DNA-binding protein [Pandoraea sputorum]